MKLSFWTRLSFTAKLTSLFVLVGIVPLVLTATFILVRFGNATESAAIEDVQVLGRAKATAIKEYLLAEVRALQDLVDHPTTKDALLEMGPAFHKMMNESSAASKIDEFKKSVESFYKEQFAKVYEEKSGRKFDAEQLMKALDAGTVVAQYDYISHNSNPIGKKNDLVQASRESQYSELHGEYHPYFRGLVDRHAWYDLFLIDTKGRLVYSVFKETDFGTSLTEGPWKDSGLARAYKKAIALQPGEVVIDDFDIYTPSYEAPASFAGSALYNRGQVIGAVIFQIPLDRISAVASDRTGLREKGETILVGSDGKLRADTHRNKEKYNVASSFLKGATLNLKFEAMDRALKGETGTLRGASYDGLDTVASYMPFNILGLKWAVVTELATEELFAMQKQIIWLLIGLVLVLSIIVVFVGLGFSKNMSGTIRGFAGTLEDLSGHVLTASNSLASSSEELSSASAEQAASLQETAASLNEISSMIEKSTGSARSMAQGSRDSLQVAEQGKGTVANLLDSMKAIDSSNEDILTQVQQSNERMNEILKVIEDIGAKTKVINEIVFQTKLLSFNASVEAARAGEHGKGFAVVAEEVGNLANMSGNAAKDISDLLGASIAKVKSITSETGQSVERLVVSGKEKVREGGEVAQQTARVLDAIIEGLTKNSDLADEVASASVEQSSGVAEINKALGQLDSATNQTASIGQAASSYALELSQRSEELKQVVDHLLAAVEGNLSSKQQAEVDDLFVEKAS